MIGRTAWIALVASIGVLVAARWMTIAPVGSGSQRSAVETLSTSASVRVPGWNATLPTICIFQKWTGWPCPTCGATRSFIALAHGRWRQAWQYHPVGYLYFALTCLNVPLRLRELRPNWFAPWMGPASRSTRRWELTAWGTAFALSLALGIGRWIDAYLS